VKTQGLVPGVLALMTTVGCFNQPQVNGDKLQCMTDDGCLAGYVCTKRPGDGTQGFGTCVKSFASAADGSVADGRNAEAKARETSVGLDTAPAIDAVVAPVDGAPDIDNAADKPAPIDSAAGAPWDASPIRGVDGSPDQNPSPDLPIVTTDAGSPDLPLPPPDGPTTETPISGTGGILATGGGSGTGTGGGLGTGGGSGTAGAPGTGGSSTPPVIDCGPLENPSNGSVTALTTTVGSEANYACQTGYGPSGSSTRYCLATGMWSGVAPSCVIANCPGLPSPLHGVVSAPTLIYGSTATYSCEPGYTRVGDETRTCQPNGTWDGAEPTCTPVDCGPLTAPANGQITMPTTTYLSTASYTCDLGYSISSNTPRTCQADKSWSGSDPTCTLVDCGALSAPTNGNVSVTTTTYGSTASYECATTFSLSGSSTRICQADGAWSLSAPTCICSSGLTDCGGVCVDTQTSNDHCGACGNLCFAVPPSTAQPCAVGRCLITLATGQTGAHQATVDSTHVYWASGVSGTVKKVPLNGGTPVTLASGQKTPNRIALNSTHIYWANLSSNGAIMQAPLGGGTAAELVPGLNQPAGLAIDATSAYWTIKTSNGTVMKASLSGGTLTTLATGQNMPTGLALDATSVYWANQVANGTIVKVSIGGGSTVTLATGQDTPMGVAVDTTSVYWGNQGGTPSIMKVPLSGGTPTILATSQSPPQALAVDENSVYWGSYSGSGAICRVPLAGGTPTIIATAQNLPTRVALDQTSAYWANYGDGTVMKVTPK